MATLTLIGEPFPDADALAHAEAARELTQAVAETAPRGCSARLLISSKHEAPTFSTARARVERVPMRANMLPRLWRAGLTARPLDGEFVHAITPMVPLRSRDEDDGSQTSVTIPHALGWKAPDMMGASAARQYRAFVKRAVRYADVVVTPTHATADALYERFGSGITVQVIPVAAPRSYLRADDSDARRAALGLPARYIASTATACEVGRLSWLFGALEKDPALPPLVLVAELGSDATGAADTATAAADDGGAAEQRANTGSESAPGGGAGAAMSATAQTSAHTAAQTPVATGSAVTGGADASAGADPTRGATSVITYGAAKRASEPRTATASQAPAITVPEALRDRVHVVHPRELADVGAVLSGAELLAVPQALIGAGYEVLGALAAGVPVVHADCAACTELALDAGVGAETEEEFAETLSRLSRDANERERLSVFAEDRSRTFNWADTARLLWELHANI